MRTITCSPRMCGRRKKGNAYLISEPSENGILPLWSDIDPPIPYEGGKQFRGLLVISLDLLLAGKNYLAGASAERERHETISEPEIRMFGMPLRTRSTIGTCRDIGLSALDDLAIKDIQVLGLSLRTLTGLQIGKAAIEIPMCLSKIQAGQPQSALASLWRMWHACPPGKKAEAAPWIQMAMYELGAGEDAMEVWE